MDKKDTCKNCGHSGSMHSDNEYTHTVECVCETSIGVYCNCMKFEPSEVSSKANEVKK